MCQDWNSCVEECTVNALANTLTAVSVKESMGSGDLWCSRGRCIVDSKGLEVRECHRICSIWRVAAFSFPPVSTLLAVFPQGEKEVLESDVVSPSLLCVWFSPYCVWRRLFFLSFLTRSDCCHWLLGKCCDKFTF